MVKIIMDGMEVEAQRSETILDVSLRMGIDIPTLCHLDLHDIKMVNRSASCRICMVQIEGRANLAPACATPVEEGMVVWTNKVRVLNARKVVLELMLSDHPKDCLVCAKSGSCELQDLSQRLGVREITYEGEQSKYRRDYSPSIIRDMDKCIMCRRCETMCNEVQTVGVYSAVNRGFEAVVATPFEINLEDSTCTYCGQCVSVCPVGALVEKDHTWRVIRALADPEKIAIVQTAPSVRAALGEEFGMEPGTLVTGKMVAVLRKMGFDYVFDTDFAADMTILEEAKELAARLEKRAAGEESHLPILTSCCPAWIKFFEHHFPDLLKIPSTVKSPQQMFGSVVKRYYGEKLGVDRDRIVMVSVMPCLAKKYEASRPEFRVEDNPDVDISISTRELAHVIKQANIRFDEVEDEDFDRPFGESTGAGVIFGTTGGVIEAAIRTAHELLCGEKVERIEYSELRGMEGVRSSEVDLGCMTLKVGIAHGLGNARKLLEDIRSGKSRFDAIEIMACPGGCIGGGGQPYSRGDLQIIKKRAEAIYSEDRSKRFRKSHENREMQQIYELYFGEDEKAAHDLIHTRYFQREKV